MKIIISLCISILIAGGLYFYSMQKNASFRHYGSDFVKQSQTPLKDILANPAAFASETIQVSGTIERQCPSSGCWFFIKDESGNQLRVELGHLGMKFPQSKGKTAVVEGRVLPSAKSLELVGNNVEFR
ncbi:MAG: DUF4920 domain-containing protein [Candidatus Riflebacteria bacterium]|nr:DUF4920 domain-containing protein [Candidatus Riflebacteria bacterium]